MKDYYRYLTVTELKDQIKDTLISAKQKLHHLSNSRRTQTQADVNQKFYNYVNQIKTKQNEYSSIMSQANELDILMNRRRNKINQSLEKYEKSIRSKTLSSFYDRALADTHLRKKEVNDIKSRYATAQGKSAEQKKYQTVSHEKYDTEPSSFSRTNPQIKQFNKTKNDPIRIVTECPSSEDRKECRPLQSITKVVNINIDTNNNTKLFSFAKDSIKAEVKKHIQQYDQSKLKTIQKKLKMQTLPTDQVNHNFQSVPSSKKKEKPAELPTYKKGLKRIKARIRQNQMINQSQWQTNKKLQNIKSLQLRYQYESFFRKDLLRKLIQTAEKNERKRAKSVK